MRNLYITLAATVIFSLASTGLAAQAPLYFPPSGSAVWDTVAAQTLGWCPKQLDSLDAFLKRKNTKSFIVLHRGKIVHERYFGTFTGDSLWYWASAGKTIMAFLTGKAQEEGKLSLGDTSSRYLGKGWTSAPPAKENLITVRDHLQMTTGLEFRVANLNCTADTCLKYRADAGTQWFYHNATYLLLHDILSSATNLSVNQYTWQKLRQNIGMKGFWVGTTYFSNARAMARFGMLMLAEAQWNGVSILNDTNFFRAMIRPSQNINPSYGYLTWLNGQTSYIPPGLSFPITGAMVPAAPADMYMAAGKDDQRIYVVPSEKLVVVRQGNAADSSFLAVSSFDNALWQELNKLRCGAPVGQKEYAYSPLGVYPNPAQEYIFSETLAAGTPYAIFDMLGRKVLEGMYKPEGIHLQSLQPGLYILSTTGAHEIFQKQ